MSAVMNMSECVNPFVKGVIEAFDAEFSHRRSVMLQQLNGPCFVLVEDIMPTPAAAVEDGPKRKRDLSSSETDLELSLSNDSTTEDSDAYNNKNSKLKRKKTSCKKILKRSNISKTASKDTNNSLKVSPNKRGRKGAQFSLVALQLSDAIVRMAVDGDATKASAIHEEIQKAAILANEKPKPSIFFGELSSDDEDAQTQKIVESDDTDTDSSETSDVEIPSTSRSERKPRTRLRNRVKSPLNPPTPSSLTSSFSSTDLSSDSTSDSESDDSSDITVNTISSDDDKESQNSSEKTGQENKKPKGSRKKREKRFVISSDSSSDECEIIEGEDQENNKNGESTASGRKNIRKILSEKELRAATKKANEDEKMRLERIENKEKEVKSIRNELQDSGRLVLEFSPDKTPLIEVDQRIASKFKKHQFEGVKFLWNCLIESVDKLRTTEGSGCIVAHSMGLGKTLQVIAFLHTLLTNENTKSFVKRCIVICPKNTVRNWANEFYIWSPSKGSIIGVYEMCDANTINDRLRSLKRWNEKGGVLIIGMHMFATLVLGGRNISKRHLNKCNKYLVDPGADIVVVDEGHLMKNDKSRINEACNQVKTKRRVILTGTPLQNCLAEYHVMMNFVKPDLLGSFKEFTNRFVNPITNGQHSDSTSQDVKLMKKRVHVLHKLLDGCVQRYDYRELVPYLEPKFEYAIFCHLTELQQKLYQFYLNNLSRSSGKTLFKDFSVFQCIWNHPSILYSLKCQKKDEKKDDLIFPPDSESDIAEGEQTVVPNESANDWFKEFISESERSVELSGKMLILFKIINECEQIQDKLVIFSQSLSLLDLVEELLQKEQTESKKWVKSNDYVRIDGSVSADQRKKLIDKFNDARQPKCRLFLLSTRAGSLGINLIGANRCVIFDASWNPTYDSQAVCRLYRFGQKKTVFVYRLIAQGTMEEKVYEKQIMKQSLSCRVVDEQQIQRHFSQRDMAELYKFFPDNSEDRPTPVLPKDKLLADLLKEFKKEIVQYKQHDSLLENRPEEDLTEEERKTAWAEWEEEKDDELQQQRAAAEMEKRRQELQRIQNEMLQKMQQMRQRQQEQQQANQEAPQQQHQPQQAQQQQHQPQQAQQQQQQPPPAHQSSNGVFQNFASNVNTGFPYRTRKTHQKHGKTYSRMHEAHQAPQSPQPSQPNPPQHPPNVPQNPPIGLPSYDKMAIEDIMGYLGIKQLSREPLLRNDELSKIHGILNRGIGVVNQVLTTPNVNNLADRQKTAKAVNEMRNLQMQQVRLRKMVLEAAGLRPNGGSGVIVEDADDVYERSKQRKTADVLIEELD